MENKKENKNGKMTLDKLARMVADGFSDVNEKIETLVTKEEMGTRFEAVDARFDTLENKINRLDLRVEEIHDIVTGLETGSILDLQKRVKVLERTVKTSR